jgi:hypothetical protein
LYFYRVQDFEYTPECIIFDLLSIPLYHGWLVDPQCHETVTALGSLGYNQIVEKIILNKCSSEIDLVTEGEQNYIFVILHLDSVKYTTHNFPQLSASFSFILQKY